MKCFNGYEDITAQYTGFIAGSETEISEFKSGSVEVVFAVRYQCFGRPAHRTEKREFNSKLEAKKFIQARIKRYNRDNPVFARLEGGSRLTKII